MSIPMKKVQPSTPHTRFREDFTALLQKHAGKMSADEMLAVAAYFVGQLIALQEQRRLSPNDAMELVYANIAQGNGDAVAYYLGKPVGNA